MEYTYKRFVNVNFNEQARASFDGYKAGDPITMTAIGSVEAATELDACEQVFIRHNQDDRTDGRVGPSMSVGDVVILRTEDCSKGFACTANGFERIQILDLNIDQRFWIDIVQQAERTHR